MHIHGIIPPVATPMQANEDLDLPRLKWFLDRLIGAGVHGVFVLGTNSEFYALDEREKQEVIATTVAHVNQRVPVYAGTEPRAPICNAEKMSVSRPISTEKRSGTTRRYSQVFCRSPLESLTPRMFGISANRATVSTSILRPPQVDGLL